MQPFEEISQKEIHQELDRISETVAMEILSQHSYVGESPSSSGVSEVKEIVKRLNLSTTSVLDTLNSVFFGKLGFKKSPLNDYYNFENNFIDKVHMHLSLYVLAIKSSHCGCNNGCTHAKIRTR